MSWTPVPIQAESWTSLDRAPRVFDPYVFAQNPVFDTGTSSGVWSAQTQQVEVWTLL